MDRWVQLRCYCSVTPREELVQTSDFVVGDLGEDPCEPSLGIDTVELGGLNQGIGDGCGFAAALGANKEKILTAQGHAADRPFSRIIVQFQKAIFQISAHFLHAAEGITDGFGQF